jgi:hypothetical protein
MPIAQVVEVVGIVDGDWDSWLELSGYGHYPLVSGRSRQRTSMGSPAVFSFTIKPSSWGVLTNLVSTNSTTAFEVLSALTDNRKIKFPKYKATAFC